MIVRHLREPRSSAEGAVCDKAQGNRRERHPRDYDWPRDRCEDGSASDKAPRQKPRAGAGGGDYQGTLVRIAKATRHYERVRMPRSPTKDARSRRPVRTD
jgi:hypothetical protein